MLIYDYDTEMKRRKMWLRIMHHLIPQDKHICFDCGKVTHDKFIPSNNEYGVILCDDCLLDRKIHFGIQKGNYQYSSVFN